VSPRPAPAEWSGEEYRIPFPDGTPLMLRGQLQAGARDASGTIRMPSGIFTALHVVVASGGYLAAACDQRIMIDVPTVNAADARPAGRCRRPACAGLFTTAQPTAPDPKPATTPEPGVFRCTECGHGGRLRAWAQVNIHGDLTPDGNIEWPDYEDDAYWPIIEESVTCKVHGEDHIEKLIDGRHVPLADLAMEGGRYVAAPAASTEGTR
jgi:hypothetical protein